MALPIKVAKYYNDIERDEKAEKYLEAFWSELKNYVLENGGEESRNKYRLYLPYTGKSLELEIDDSGKAGTKNDVIAMRERVKDICQIKLEKKGQWIEHWDYVNGTVDVGMNDQDGNVKIRKGQKIGKIIQNVKEPLTGKSLTDFFSNDPIRLSKDIIKNINTNNLWLAISAHPYDIAGMSANRNWTSCMNIFGGDMADYVEYDIEFGTVICYIISKEDKNINNPIGRVLIKPYKLARKGYKGTDPAPIVYSPEVTVYSPYVGMKPIRDFLKDICEEIQGGEGTLRSLKQLYNDTFHDKADKEFKGKKQ